MQFEWQILHQLSLLRNLCYNRAHYGIGGEGMDFLPTTPEEMKARGWEAPDFVYVVGEAYVDHPSFGPAVIGRVLEAEGYRVAMLAQPDWRNPDAFSALGKPR